MAIIRGTDPLVDAYLQRVGKPMEPALVRDRIARAMTFFQDRIGWDVDARLDSFLECIDYSSEVQDKDLLMDEEVIGYRNASCSARLIDPFGLYFTKVGVSKHDVGINVDNRLFVRYLVRRRVAALHCRSENRMPRGMSGSPGMGGGPQIIIPQASQHLRVTHIQFEAR